MDKQAVCEFVDNYIKQDNRGTRWPYSYVVQQKTKDYVAEGCGDNKEYYWDCETHANRDDAIKAGCPEDDLLPVYYDIKWEDVQWFYTEVEAEKYLKRNSHNLNKTRLYVNYWNRNSEAELFLRTMFSIAGKDYDKESIK